MYLYQAIHSSNSHKGRTMVSLGQVEEGKGIPHRAGLAGRLIAAAGPEVGVGVGWHGLSPRKEKWKPARLEKERAAVG